MPGAGRDNAKVQNLLTGSRHSFYLTQAVEADRQKPGCITDPDSARGGATRQTWPTVTAQDAKNDGGPSQSERNTVPLNTAVKSYATPRAEDSQCAGRRHNRDTSDTLYAQTVTDTKAVPGSLNPNWVEWLMSWPIGWSDASLELQWECPNESTACEHLGTVRCLSAWQRRSRTWLERLGC